MYADDIIIHAHSRAETEKVAKGLQVVRVVFTLQFLYASNKQDIMY